MTKEQKRALAAKARQAVADQIRLGKMVRGACAICGKRKSINGRAIQAHHEDYSKPLDVIWLCIWCHHGIHRKNKPLQLPNRRYA